MYLVENEPVEAIRIAVKQIEEKRAGQQFLIVGLVLVDQRTTLALKPLDMLAHPGKRGAEFSVADGPWKKAGDFAVHLASKVTKGVGINGLVDQLKEVTFR